MSGITNSFPAGGIDEAGVNELIAAATAGGAKITTGSYTGTGKTALSLVVQPTTKVLIIGCASSSAQSGGGIFISVRGIGWGISDSNLGGTASHYMMNVTWSTTAFSKG